MKLDIPEINALDGRTGFIRIPQEIDIPLTPRVRAIIDSAPFRRLANISQLGLVSLVYPAAHHSRFEHSLGVYRLSLLYLQQLMANDRFQQAVSQKDAELLIVSCLLHDIGHWPFCHPIEDMQLDSVPQHESFAQQFLENTELAEILKGRWDIETQDVVRFLSGQSKSAAEALLQSMLSGPIDVDKMDYLMRDSLHAGVPYGRNFDQHRLISSLHLNETNDKLAITEKGKTAAEMMVFARYVMFSEVYWHHAVRSATAMLQRIFFHLKEQLDLQRLFVQTETEFIKTLQQASQGTLVESLVDHLFGEKRRLYKRLAQYGFLDNPTIYQSIARNPYAWLQGCATRYAKLLSQATNQTITAEQVLIDAPPQKLEVEFNVDVYFKKQDCYRTLGEVSPVVNTLAKTQFDRYVKQVRIFIAPELSDLKISTSKLDDILQTAIQDGR